MKPPFTSLRYPFAVDPARGRVEHETDYAEHVDQMIRQILLTGPGERINRPDFGCGVRRMVFAPNGAVSASLARVTVFDSLTRWLGTAITVSDVTAEAVDSTLKIRIAYVLKARQERRYLNLEVTF
jgi:phage baseplate assembly protein W